MTPEIFLKALARDECLVIHISPQNFSDLESLIRHRAYTYRPQISLLTIKMATQIHATVTDWARQLINAGIAAGAYENVLELIGQGRMERFQGQYQNIVKVPDVAVFPGKRMWPTVAFEFGYSEPYDQLKEDAKLLLEGTAGEITKVIIIKLEPLMKEETEIKAGFVEIWCLEAGQAKKDGGRKKLFPPPKARSKQRLELTLEDLLREQFDNTAADGWAKDDIIDLPLDLLRISLDKAVERHLFQKRRLPEN